MNNISQEKLAKKYKQQAYEQAAEWYMLMQEQTLTAQQQIEFDTWLAENEIHQNVWKNVTIFDEKFHRVPKQTITKTMQQIERNPLIIAGKLSLAFISFFAALYAAQGIRQQDLLPDLFSFEPIDIYKTNIGEQQQIALSDGSQIWLNSNSKLRVKYTNQQRHLELTRGEIFIETHKDQQQRPFTVQTQHGNLLALGTVFNVRYFPEHTQLMVEHGAVRIYTAQKQQDIVAQHSATFDKQQIYPQQYNNSQLLWKQHLLVVHSMPLKQFVAELARYYQGEIELDTQLEDVLISGSYSTVNIQKTLDMVANTHQLNLQTQPEKLRILP